MNLTREENHKGMLFQNFEFPRREQNCKSKRRLFCEGKATGTDMIQKNPRGISQEEFEDSEKLRLMSAFSFLSPLRIPV